MIYLFVILFFGVMVAYVMGEVTHYRKGNDVYEWTKKLVNWMDRK